MFFGLSKLRMSNSTAPEAVTAAAAFLSAQHQDMGTTSGAMWNGCLDKESGKYSGLRLPTLPQLNASAEDADEVIIQREAIARQGPGTSASLLSVSLVDPQSLVKESWDEVHSLRRNGSFFLVQLATLKIFGTAPKRLCQHLRLIGPSSKA